jgi:hypothetical protein
MIELTAHRLVSRPHRHLSLACFAWNGSSGAHSAAKVRNAIRIWTNSNRNSCKRFSQKRRTPNSDKSKDGLSEWAPHRLYEKECESLADQVQRENGGPPLRQDRFVDAKAPAIVGPVDGSTSR